MSYLGQADLADDQTFGRRLTACTTEQAAGYVNDPDVAVRSLAERILADAGLGLSWFRWPVATQPGFGDAGGQDNITDGQLLAAVQAVWPQVAAIHPPDLAADEAWT